MLRISRYKIKSEKVLKICIHPSPWNVSSSSVCHVCKPSVHIYQKYFFKSHLKKINAINSTSVQTSYLKNNTELDSLVFVYPFCRQEIRCATMLSVQKHTLLFPKTLEGRTGWGKGRSCWTLPKGWSIFPFSRKSSTVRFTQALLLLCILLIINSFMPFPTVLFNL